MVEVAPLKAVEYNLTKVDLAQIVTPPYDIVNAEERKILHAQSPYNFSHVTLHDSKIGRKKVDPHQEALRLLQEWTEKGILVQRPDEAIYAYECAYQLHGQPKRMRGVLVRLRLDPTYTQILPHEEIFAKYSEDRAKILQATGYDLEPIQLLYSGRSVEDAMWAYVDGSQRAADLTAAGRDGAVHRYWRIEDPAVIGTVVEGFKGRKGYIADGHHRYAAACKYAEERRLREYRPPKNSPWEYKLSLFVNLNDPGLSILPTHRVVLQTKSKDPLAAWSKDFEVRPIALQGSEPVRELQKAMQAASEAHVLGAWLGDAGQGHLLVAREPAVPEASLPKKSLSYRSLDVVFLQHQAVEPLGIPSSRWGEDVYYTRDDAEAATMVKTKKAKLVLTHRPTKLLQLRAIADVGEKMPPKSTYFMPKTLSGVMMHKIGLPVGPPSKPRITS